MIENARRLAQRNGKRALEDQYYYDNVTFIPISVADSSGDTVQIRIAVVWDIINGGDNDFYDDSVSPPVRTTISRQCSSVGEYRYRLRQLCCKPMLQARCRAVLPHGPINPAPIPCLQAR